MSTKFELTAALGRRASGGACLRALSTQCRRLERYVIALALVASACVVTPPPNLSPTGQRIWQANEIVIALKTAQSAAIGFNSATICSEDPVPVCNPMLSTENTRIVVEATRDALISLRATPTSWYAVGFAAAERMEQRLGAAGQDRMRAYLAALRFVLSASLGK